MKKFDNIVYIGRFQPFHKGHQAVIDHALTLAHKVVVLLGSANISRTPKNPLTAEERALIILRHYHKQEGRFSVECATLNDDLYNNTVWVSSVQEKTAHLTGKTALIGHKRDHSSFYLDMFPQWDYIEVDDFNGINATKIRNLLYHSGEISEDVPCETHKFLQEWTKTETYATMVREWRFINEYKRKWETAPYEPTFVTVDAVFVHSGHLLLVKRKFEPGKGLWALPGGFIGQTETLEAACIRELREETRLKLPEKVIKGSQKGFHVFDHPDRSARGRTITNAFFYEIETGPLPLVKGSDDAAEAKWVPIAQLAGMETKFFEDHGFLIKYFLGS